MSWYTGPRATTAMVALVLPALLGLGALPASAVVLPGSTAADDEKVILTCPAVAWPPPGPRIDDGGQVTLREAAERDGILIGTALPAWQLVLADQQHRDVAGAEFNIINSSNQMFWNGLQPERNVYNFCHADRFVALAEANGQALRGHALVAWQRDPNWLTEGDFSREELIEILRDYIHTVVGHYKGKVALWDVVSEAIQPDGSLRPGVLADGIGPEYIEMAFRFAREADPDALLMYDDFLTNRPGPKQDGVFDLVQGLRAKGVPVDVVGIEMFNSSVGRDSMIQLREALDRFATLGVETAITQLTVPLMADWHTRIHQANTYSGALNACLTSTSCRMFTVWGFSDVHHLATQTFANATDSHNTGREPYLFDELHRRKPAWYAVRDRLLQTIATEVSFTEDSDSSGQHSDPVQLQARLVDVRGAPMADQELTFELATDGSDRTFTTTTGPDGVATVEVTLDQPAGTYGVGVAFGGDDRHRTATAAGEFTVQREDSVTALTVTGIGAGRTLDARLSDLDTPSQGVPGRTITFLADGQPIGQATTGADGVATFTPPPRYWGAAPVTFEARFAGDDHYLPSSDQQRT